MISRSGVQNQRRHDLAQEMASLLFRNRRRGQDFGETTALVTIHTR